MVHMLGLAHQCKAIVQKYYRPKKPSIESMLGFLVDRSKLYTASLSIYKNNNAIAIAGKTRPTVGTRIEGRKEAAMIKIPLSIMNLTLDLKLADRQA